MENSADPNWMRVIFAGVTINFLLFFSLVVIKKWFRRTDVLILKELKHQHITSGQRLVTEKIYINEKNYFTENVSGKSTLFFKRLVEKSFEACDSVGPIKNGERKAYIEVSHFLSPTEAKGFKVRRIARVNNVNIWTETIDNVGGSLKN